MAATVAVGAALVAAIATLLPWTVSGTVGRNAFATVGSAVRLGVLADGPGVLLALGGDAVPFLALAALLAHLTERPRTSLVLAAVAGAAAASLAVLVLRGPVAAGVGAPVGLVAGVVAVGAAGVAGWRGRA